jgi:hypothetical protein
MHLPIVHHRVDPLSCSSRPNGLILLRQLNNCAMFSSEARPRRATLPAQFDDEPTPPSGVKDPKNDYDSLSSRRRQYSGREGRRTVRFHEIAGQRASRETRGTGDGSDDTVESPESAEHQSSDQDSASDSSSEIYSTYPRPSANKRQKSRRRPSARPYVSIPDPPGRTNHLGDSSTDSETCDEGYDFSLSSQARSQVDPDISLDLAADLAEEGPILSEAQTSASISSTSKLLHVLHSRYVGDWSVGGLQRAQLTAIHQVDQRPRKGTTPIFRWV